jgi:hypothetical protein
MQTTIDPILLILVTAIVAGTSAYFGTYLKEKGKGLATKEDIGHVTDIVEEIRAQHATTLEHLKSRQQLRIAAIDKRLQVHQEAFTLWRRLLSAVHEENVATVVIECQTWWEHNALYLEPEVRDAFNRAYFAANHHKSFVDNPTRNEASITALQDNWKLLMSTGNVIMDAVALPALNEQEQRRTEDVGADVREGGAGTGISTDRPRARLDAS